MERLKLIEKIKDLVSEIDFKIIDNQYEPYKWGNGTVTREETINEIESDIQDLIVETLKGFDIEFSFDRKSFDTILKEAQEYKKCNEVRNFLYDLIELEELCDKEEKECDEDGNIYRFYYYKHKKENRVIELYIQSDVDDSYFDTLLHIREVVYKKIVIEEERWEAV